MSLSQILILIATVLLIAYLALFFYVTSKIAYFRSALKGRIKALAVIFSQKKEVLLALTSLYEKLGASLKEEDQRAVNRAKWLIADVQTAGEIEGCAEILKTLEKRLNYIAATDQNIAENEEALTLKGTLNELDFNYRRVAAGYNSDVLGYNYWRGLWACRFVYFLVRLPYLKQIS